MHCLKKNSLLANKAITFIELVIVVSMVAVISLTIYSTLSNGVKIWQRITVPLPEEDITISLEKFTSDIRNICWFKGIIFSGTKDSLEFPAFVNSPALNKRTTGSVSYIYNFQDNKLERWEKDFSAVYRRQEGRLTHSLKQVNTVKFQYYMYNEDEKKYLWVDEWKTDNLPLAVRMQFEFGTGNNIQEYVKTVSIPISS